jgi:hypothetical protein
MMLKAETDLDTQIDLTLRNMSIGSPALPESIPKNPGLKA